MYVQDPGQPDGQPQELGLVGRGADLGPRPLDGQDLPRAIEPKPACRPVPEVMHLHVHVIPRRTGDIEDPRGGIRWILPTRARYWTERP